MQAHASSFLVAILLGSAAVTRAQSLAPASTPPGEVSQARQKANVGLAPTGASTPATDPLAADDPLASGLVQEEGNLNLEAAIKSYRSVIDNFDHQRQRAATAIFRLGESYRKLGRLEEAKVQYARILREFSDQAAVARASQKYLFESPAPDGPAGAAASFQNRLQQIVRRGGQGEDAPELPDSASRPGLGSNIPGRLPEAGSAANSPFGLNSGMGGGGSGRFSGGGGFGGGFGSAGGGAMGRTTRGQFQNSLLNQEADERFKLLRQLEQSLATEQNSADEVNRLSTLIETVRTAPAEALPDPVKRDPRYAQLKQNYEDALINDNDRPESLNSTEQKRKRLKTWVEKIGLPELQTELELATKNLQESHLKAEMIRKKLKIQEETGTFGIIKDNLRHIEGAKEQWALENKKREGELPEAGNIAAYLRGGELPRSIAGEKYDIQPLGQPPTAKLTKPLGGFPAGTTITPATPIEGAAKP